MAEQERADVAAARTEWRIKQPGLNPARLVFLDESGFSTNRARRLGWSPRGQRLVAALPHGYWKMSTLVPGLRVDGTWIVARITDGGLHVIGTDPNEGDVVVDTAPGAEPTAP